MCLQSQSCPKRMLLVIYAYGDDGSDARHERVTAVSIIAGYEEWWREVEDQWIIRCNGIPFHATDCESNPPRGDYRDRLSHQEAKDMYRDLTGIIASSRLGGIGIGFDLVAQKKVFPNSPLDFAYYRALIDCLMKVSNVAENFQDVCEVTYDISRENEAKAAMLYASLRESEERFSRLLHSKISFKSWRDNPRLQVADLLAFEAWKALDHTVGPIKRKRKSWDLLRATNRFETYSYGEEWFSSLKAHKDSGELEKLVGFNESDYLSWLSRQQLKHNSYNIFAFIRSRNEK